MARYFDRVLLPEQLLSALPEAMRVLTNPSETGAVVIALPQDIQSKSFDFPDIFFDERDWEIGRVAASRNPGRDCGQSARSSGDHWSWPAEALSILMQAPIGGSSRESRYTGC